MSFPSHVLVDGICPPSRNAGLLRRKPLASVAVVLVAVAAGAAVLVASVLVALVLVALARFRVVLLTVVFADELVSVWLVGMVALVVP